jgi:hypothetical protein
MTTNRSTLAGRREIRGAYAGTPETRSFAAVTGGKRAIRSAATSSGGIEISGKPIMYRTPYQVRDSLGSFSERVMPGALKSILATCDCRFLFDHSGLCMARTTSGTMTLADSPSSLTFKARLDPRQTVAQDLAIAMERGDISQMSMSFTIAPGGDSWDSTMTNRTITRFSSLLDVSAVTYPCSPTTSIELEAKPDPVGGPDGSIGANWPSGPGGVADGTGSRNLKFDLASMRSRILRNRSQVLVAMRQAGASDEAIELQRARFRRTDAMARNRAFDRQLSELS